MWLTTLYKLGWVLVHPRGAYPGESNSCISIRPGFLCIEGGPMGGLEVSATSATWSRV